MTTSVSTTATEAMVMENSYLQSFPVRDVKFVKQTVEVKNISVTF